MKKFLSILAMSALLIPIMSGCDGEKTKPTPTPTPEPTGKVILSISASAELYPEQTGSFTISSETEATEAIVITLTNSNKEVITVPETVTLEAGQKSVKGSFSAIKAGEAVITISAENVTIEKNSASVTVLADTAEILSLSPDNPDAPTVRAGFVWVPMSGQGGFYYHNKDWDGNGNTQTKISYDIYGGDVVGERKEQGIVFKAVEKDTPIDDNLPWMKTGWENDGSTGTKYTCMPYIVIEGDYSAGTGETYLVCTLPINGKGTSDFARAWVKVNIDPVAMTVTFIEGAMCTNDAEFKVGQQ